MSCQLPVVSCQWMPRLSLATGNRQLATLPLMAKPLLIAIVLCGLIAADAHAVKVADVTRVGGQRRNFLVGLGLVVGLNGTGDGGDYAATINPLREMLAKFADPVTARELEKVNNVAIVSLTAVVPPNGVREG